jgi:uncharacterized protein (DUF1800 family)
MGFGGTTGEIEELASKGREGAVDYLINYNQIDNKPLEDLLAQNFDFSDITDNQKLNNAEIRRWWYTRMVHTRRQFEEKMTLFWHNHFATSSSKVQDFYMYLQNLTLRANALPRFDDLLLKMAQDPAMILWLDSRTNVVGRPNENFGRELMELFTMGINDVVTGQPNYTEDDVKEVARAFTGWDFNQNRRDGGLNFQFVIRQNLHDNTTKTVFAGTPFAATGNLNGTDIIDILSDRPQTARYLSKKLLDFFVFPVTTSNSDRNLIDRFANVYLNNNHSIKALVTAIFTSDEFFSDRARFALVKQPVEFIVSAVRMLKGSFIPGSNLGEGRRQVSNTLSIFGRNMGQDLFGPPDVAGWDFNLGWVNTASMLERFNYANAYISNRNTTNPGLFITNDELKKNTKGTSKKTVKKFLKVLGPLDPGSDVVKMLRSYLETDDNGNKVKFVNDDLTVDKKVRGLVHQIMCLPEFQLN